MSLQERVLPKIEQMVSVSCDIQVRECEFCKLAVSLTVSECELC